MKIGIIHPSFEIIGGAEQTTISLLKSLRHRYEMTLFTTSKNINIPSGNKIFHIKRNSFPIGWSFQRIIEIKKLFKKAKNEDILFVSSGNLVLSDTKKEIILYCHSTFEAELKKISNKKNGFFSFYHNYIKNQLKNQIKLLKNPTVHLIANSNYTKEKIAENFQKKSDVIFPPVQIKNQTINYSKKSGIITVSRYSPEKNLEFNLKVIKNIDTAYKVYGNAKFLSQTNHYDDLQNKVKNSKLIKLFCNSKRSLIEDSLYSSKVYFQSSKETFGISVIEGIMAGCIPIVPNNTANKETVPIDNLRYKENDENDAKMKIEAALRGDFDKYLPELQEYVKKFSEENFQKNMVSYLAKFEKNNMSNIK